VAVIGPDLALPDLERGRQVHGVRGPQEQIVGKRTIRIVRGVIGRNSATGSPRRSITMMLPSAASRTNSEV